MPELWLALGAGLFSSLHCVGMCGPIVAGMHGMAPEPVQIELGTGGGAAVSTRRVLVFPHVLYHGGRVVSYSMIGMIAGMVGGASMISPVVQQTFTIAFGVLMIAMALFQMDVFKRRIAKPRQGKLTGALRSLVHSRANESRFLIGLLTPLLPCGLLYAMALHSAATHSPVLGAMEMGVFALGAAPALAVVATLSHAFGSRIRKYGTTFAAIFVIVMGSLTVLRGAGIYHSPFSAKTDADCCTPPAHMLQQQ